MALCDTPCFTLSMSCMVTDDIIIDVGLTINTDYRVMAQDAFGNKRISANITSDPYTGQLLLPLSFIGDWIDLGAHITLTVLAENTNEAQDLTLGDDDEDATCVLLIFDTDGSTIVT